MLDTLSADASARGRHIVWDGELSRAVWAVEKNSAWVVLGAYEWSGPPYDPGTSDGGVWDGEM